MRTRKEYEVVMGLCADGINNSEISRRTNIPRRTIVDWVLGKIIIENEPDTEPTLYLEKIKQEYCYLLGAYLGDGYIDIVRKTHRLRITCDAKYPHVIERIENSIKAVLPNNKVGRVIRHSGACVDVYVFSNMLPILFPHLGIGKKHERKIIIQTWQKDIIQTNSTALLQGLFDSDGSWFSYQGTEYIELCNCSVDIINLWRDAWKNQNVNVTENWHKQKNCATRCTARVRSRDYLKASAVLKKKTEL